MRVYSIARRVDARAVDGEGNETDQPQENCPAIAVSFFGLAFVRPSLWSSKCSLNPVSVFVGLYPTLDVLEYRL